MYFNPIISRSNTPDTLVISTPGGIKIANFDEKKKRISLRSEARQFIKSSRLSEEEFKEELKHLVARWKYQHSPMRHLNAEQTKDFFNCLVGMSVCLGAFDNIRQEYNKLADITGDESMKLAENPMQRQFNDLAKAFGMDNLADILDESDEVTELAMQKAIKLKVYEKLLEKMK